MEKIPRSWHGTCFRKGQNDLECWPAQAVKHGRVRLGRPVHPGRAGNSKFEADRSSERFDRSRRFPPDCTPPVLSRFPDRSIFSDRFIASIDRPREHPLLPRERSVGSSEVRRGVSHSGDGDGDGDWERKPRAARTGDVPGPACALVSGCAFRAPCSAVVFRSPGRRIALGLIAPRAGFRALRAGSASARATLASRLVRIRIRIL